MLFSILWHLMDILGWRLWASLNRKALPDPIGLLEGYYEKAEHGKAYGGIFRVWPSPAGSRGPILNLYLPVV
jgi:hypothetical protein